jgi:hypothetical protein
MNALHLERLISKGGLEPTWLQTKGCALLDTFSPWFIDDDHGHINTYYQACRITAAKTLQIYSNSLVVQDLLISSAATILNSRTGKVHACCAL